VSGALRNLGLALVAAGLIANKTRMPKWLCTGCGLRYGDLGKATYGYCAACWEVWLAECRLNVARAQLDWQREKIGRCLEMESPPCVR
jgi:hypothetical protein